MTNVPVTRRPAVFQTLWSVVRRRRPLLVLLPVRLPSYKIFSSFTIILSCLFTPIFIMPFLMPVLASRDVLTSMVLLLVLGWIATGLFFLLVLNIQRFSAVLLRLSLVSRMLALGRTIPRDLWVTLFNFRVRLKRSSQILWWSACWWNIGQPSRRRTQGFSLFPPIASLWDVIGLMKTWKVLLKSW